MIPICSPNNECLTETAQLLQYLLNTGEMHRTKAELQKDPSTVVESTGLI